MKTELSLLACLALPVSAAEFQGAASILDRLASASARAKNEEVAGPSAELFKKFETFRREAVILPQAAAVSRWLELYDAVSALRSHHRNSFPGQREFPDFSTLLTHLPPTAAWPALADAINARIEKRKDPILRCLTVVLQGDFARRKATLEAIVKDAKDAEYDESTKERIESLAMRLIESEENTSDPLRGFERLLERIDKDGDHFGTLYVPALVRLAGEEKARTLLLAALLKSSELEIRDQETLKLAKRLAAENIEKLKVPPWNLIDSIEDAPLHEALVQRFPEAKAYDRKKSAMSVYLGALIVADRIKEARDLLLNEDADFDDPNSETLEILRQKNAGRKFIQLLNELLRNDPALPYWNSLIALSANEGETLSVLTLLRELERKPDLDQEVLCSLREHLAEALLASNEVDEAVRVLREIIRSMPIDRTPPAAAVSDNQVPPGADGNGDDDRRDRLESACTKLAELGDLFQRPEWLKEAITTAEAIARKDIGSELNMEGNDPSCLDILIRFGSGTEAEAVVTEWMLRAASRSDASRIAAKAIGKLVSIYHASGRHADILLLLERSPYWNVGDLADVAFSSYAFNEGESLSLITATALAKTGRTGEALRVTERALQDDLGKDASYQLLLSLGPANFGALMDKLAKLDRFQERPLIWKAKWFFDAGRTEEAEKTVKAAIAIDPSDGEQGKGDRMRAHAVLGDILEKKGDVEQAKVMRGVIGAIRLSEKADDWNGAGLHSRAAKMYEDALGLFADAYCIQSRLAMAYNELGDHARAAEHYERAFELMPGSFGWIESHCFGCEGAFDGEQAQGIAERVFTKLAKQTPDRPQVFYLLGYLRETQGRDVEAAGMYRKAVKLNPDYYNAWVKLAALIQRVPIPGNDIEESTRALLRLDPARIRSSRFADSRDLGVVWDAILAGEKAREALSSGPYFPLPASQAELDKMKDIKDPFGGRNIRRTKSSAREEFARHPLIESVSEMMSALRARS